VLSTRFILLSVLQPYEKSHTTRMAHPRQSLTCGVSKLLHLVVPDYKCKAPLAH
jgi:hypothetical protein